MKKFLTVLLCVALILAMSIPALAQQHEKSGKAARGTVVIDGTFKDEYTAAERLTTDNVFEENDTPAARAEVWVLWDNEALYIYADVKDKTPSGSNEGTPWTSDSIEFFFDWDNNHASVDATYGDNGGQIRFSAYASLFGHDILTVGGQSYAGWIKSNESTMKYVVKTYNGGYIVEAKIPYNDAIKGMAKEGAHLGFGIQVNDTVDADINSTDSARSGHVEWAVGAEANQGWQWSGALDRLILSGDTYVAPVPVVEETPAEQPAAAEAAPAPVVAVATAPASVPATGDTTIVILMCFVLISTVAIVRINKIKVK